MLKVLHVVNTVLETDLLAAAVKRHSPNTGIKFSAAPSVEVIKKLLTDEQFDSVIIDWDAPNVDGAMISAFIRSRNNTLPIIVMSGEINDDYISISQEYNIRAFLNKDLSKETIESLATLV